MLCADVADLRRRLLAWWDDHGRHAIPWKCRPDGGIPADGEPLDPYGVWVAEVMLQQTQLAVVLPYWHRWQQAFPGLEVLAAADHQVVLWHWQGLGYYSRARRLQQGARQLVAAASSDPFPRSLEGWLALPGVGRSTAGSILSWRGACAAYAAGDPVRYPVKEARRDLPFQVIGVGVVLNAAGEVLIDQRLPEGLLGGLWEFPGGKQEPEEAIVDTIERELQEELAIRVVVGEELITLDHAYSHKRLRFVVHLCRWLEGEPQPLACQQVRWVSPAALADYPFPAANARIIAALQAWLERSGTAAAPALSGGEV